MRTMVLAVVLLLMGCAARMARVEPVRTPGQDVLFKNGTPVVMSRGRNFDVVIAPKTGPTGRYKVEPRLFLMVAVRNRSGQRIELSESNFSAQGNGARARVVLATEIEDEVQGSAAWAQAMNAFAGAVDSLAAAGAGTTYHNLTISGPGAASESVTGTSTNQGAIDQAQRRARADAEARRNAISANESFRLGQVATMLQRNTLEPESAVSGVLVIEPPRLTACRVIRVEGSATSSPSFAAGPCQIVVTATLGGETHTFVLEESFSP